MVFKGAASGNDLGDARPGVLMWASSSDESLVREGVAEPERARTAGGKGVSAPPRRE